MVKNYVKTAFRNVRRNKSYAFINAMGLAVGIAACFLIFLVVQFKGSFDNFHSKKNSIYRIGSEFHTQDGVTYSGGVSFPVAKTVRLDFAQVKEVASIYRNVGQITVPDGSNQLQDTYVKSNMDDWVGTFGGEYTFVVLSQELTNAKFRGIKNFC